MWSNNNNSRSHLQAKIFAALMVFAAGLTAVIFFFGNSLEYIVKHGEHAVIEKLSHTLKSQIVIKKRTLTLDQLTLEGVSVEGKVHGKFDKIVLKFRLGAARTFGPAAISEVEIFGQSLQISRELLASVANDFLSEDPSNSNKKTKSRFQSNMPKLARIRLQKLVILNDAQEESFAIVDLAGRFSSSSQILELNANDIRINASATTMRTGPVKLSQVFQNDFQRINWRVSPTGTEQGAPKFSLNGSIDLDRNIASFSGQLRQHQIDHPLIAKQAIGPYDFRVAANINWNSNEGLLRVDEAEFNILKEKEALQPPIRLRGDGSIKLAKAETPQLLINGQIKIPPTACSTLLQLDPEHLTPRISQTYNTTGSVSALLKLNVDLFNLENAEFSFDDLAFRCHLNGRSALASAQVVGLERAGTPITTAYQVQSTFPSLYPRTWFVPFANIPEKLTAIVVASEDIGFFNHQGIDRISLGAALKRNLSFDKATLGGSTITMQLARNIFLSPERTVVRKIEEVFFTKLLEDHLSKERILELYLNSAEFGPGIYGVSAAANHFFEKRVQDLNLREIVYLVSILPGPTTRYKYFCDGEVTENMNRLLERKVSDLRKLGRINDDEFGEYNRTPLYFSSSHRSGSLVCQKGRDRA